MLIAFLITLILGSCKTNTNVDFCLLYTPIKIDPDKDTIETQRAIIRYNLLHEGMCQ